MAYDGRMADTPDVRDQDNPKALDGDRETVSSFFFLESFLRDYDTSLDDKAAAAHREFLDDKAEESGNAVPIHEALSGVMYVPSTPALVKFSANTTLVQEFDHLNQKWSHTMSVKAGRGKRLYEAARDTPTGQRLVPRDTAFSFGAQTGTCLICGKRLSDAASLHRGYGPECARKVDPRFKPPEKAGTLSHSPSHERSVLRPRRGGTRRCPPSRRRTPALAS